MTKRQSTTDGPPPIVRVEITAGGHQVVIEAAGSLNVVKKAALDLFRDTDNPNITRGAGSGFGLAGEIAHTDLPEDLTLRGVQPWDARRPR